MRSDVPQEMGERAWWTGSVPRMDLDAETDEDADKKTEENEASYEEALGLLNGYVEEELKYIKVSPA